MDFKLDSTGDLDLSTYDLQLTEGLEAIQQHLIIKFKDIQGEWVFDSEVGFPWFEEVLVRNPSFTEIQNVFVNELMDTPGVLEVLDFDFEFENSAATIDAQILADDGIIDFSLFQIV